VPEAARRAYSIGEIRHWLEVFLKRFFGQSQYKRTAMPNGPKVGSGGSLSPRGDWRAPTDGTAAPWLAALREVPEAE
jgi:NAD+ synthase (glutamine-hydrolysing)